MNQTPKFNLWKMIDAEILDYLWGSRRAKAVFYCALIIIVLFIARIGVRAGWSSLKKQAEVRHAQAVAWEAAHVVQIRNAKKAKKDDIIVYKRGGMCYIIDLNERGFHCRAPGTTTPDYISFTFDDSNFDQIDYIVYTEENPTAWIQAAKKFIRLQ